MPESNGIEVQRLVAVLEARLNKYEKDLDRASNQTDRSFRRIEERGKRMESKLQQTFRGLSQSAQLMYGPLSGIASRVTTLGGVVGSVNPVMAGMALALGGVSFAAIHAIREFSRFEVQQETIAQILRATGGASGKTAEDIENLAQSIAANTLATTTGIREAAQVLLTFRSISGDTFDETLKLTQDLAQVGFGTAKTAALQLGKALEDPILGISALREVGVSFSEAQKGTIRTLYETGRAAEAQAVLLQVLKSQVGGAGSAAARNTLAGAYDTLIQSTEKLLVTWGRQIADSVNLRAALRGVAGSLNDINVASGGGSLDEQLTSVNKRIRELRDLAPEAKLVRNILGSVGLDSLSEQGELNKLLVERARIQELIVKREQAQAEAARQARQAQEDGARERAQGVVASLERELELAGKTAVEKRTIVELGRAGVTAESEYGRQIALNVALIEKAKEAVKAREKESQLDRASTKLREEIALRNAETAALLKANPLLSDYGHAAAYAEAKQRLLNAAQRDGATITPELLASVDALARAYASAAANGERVETNQRDIKRTAEQLQSVSESAVSTLVKDLRDGVSASEALGKALSSVADTLIDIGTQALVKKAFEGLLGLGGTSGGGASGGLLGGLLIPGILHSGGVAGRDGYGHGRAVSPSVFSGAPRYHNGGVAGLKPNEVPAILQRGEVVTPASKAGASRSATSIVVSPVFHVQNGTPEGVDRLRNEIVPIIERVARVEIAQQIDRNPVFAPLKR